VSVRKKQRSASATCRLRSAERAFTKAISRPETFARAIGTAEALMRQIRLKGRRPVTLRHALKSVVMILVFHLSGFDYRTEQASPRARTARILAALSVVLTDTVTCKRTR
jgi:hypothetical protein